MPFVFLKTIKHSQNAKNHMDNFRDNVKDSLKLGFFYPDSKTFTISGKQFFLI